MNFQPYQLMLIGSYLVIAFFVFKTNNKRIRYLLIAIALIMFFANPFRMTATSIKQVERGTSKFDEMPDRIIVEQPSFNDFNQSEIDKFNKLYEETKNEIHN